MNLITGGTGQLGSAFRRSLPEVLAPSHEEMDLAHPEQVADYLRRAAPRVIVNCAAYTAVDRAESEEDLATIVNGDSVGVMARYAATVGIPFITFSTDYVFDGTSDRPYVETDSPNPIGAYGRSKLRGEQAALSAYPEALVIRTSWVVSGTHSNFVATMLRLARERDRIDVVSDQVGCPTFVDDLMRATLAALDAGARGLLHLTNRGSTSWFHFAEAALVAAGEDPGKLHPIDTGSYPTEAARPRYSVLGSERRAEFGIELPSWEESLGPVVAQLKERSR